MGLYINLKEVPGDPEISCGPAHQFESGSKGPRKLMGLNINLREVPGAQTFHGPANKFEGRSQGALQRHGPAYKCEGGPRGP